MKITRYKISAPEKMKAAVVADLHGKPTSGLYEALKAEKPDVILVPGDLCTIGEYDDRSVAPERREKWLRTQKEAISFLKTAVDIAPVYYSRGNHEWSLDDEYRNTVKETSTVLLENEWAEYCPGLFIGGLNSAQCCNVNKDGKESTETRRPDIDWLKRSTPDGYRLLLCHHPEYYPAVEPYADCILSAHAHGGMWRLFGRGVYAPGQGLWPTYTKGVYGKMIVSAGLTNTVKYVPRFFNPTELVIITFGQ